MVTARSHEVSFCARVKSWAEALLAREPALLLGRAEIEESTTGSRKRSDLGFYDRQGNLRLTGEVKLPGTPAGRNAFAASLIEDAASKASNAGAEYFFTWNVNQLILFDAKQWQKPLLERQVKAYDLGLKLTSPGDLDRPELANKVQHFVEAFLREFCAIADGSLANWATPPDEFFIRAFESHIAWPVSLTADYLAARVQRDRAFDHRLQEWLAQDQGWLVMRQDPLEWAALLDRAARTLCYVFANRLLFYEAVRVRYPSLTAPVLPALAADEQGLYKYFQGLFQVAVETIGDYETLFYPYEGANDWTGSLIFAAPEARDAWRSVVSNLQPFDFQHLRSDILGDIFKRLIAPEERHKYGQHYTNEDLVDLVNAFCLRRANDTVLDPACGSGSFLVRAYHRKAWLNQHRQHETILAELFGADITLFAAHLATLNLAARNIKEDENYPRIRRGNFFQVIREVQANGSFCRLPSGLKSASGVRPLQDIDLPLLDAIVGNPPYVRQELIPKFQAGRPQPPLTTKEELAELLAMMWPGLHLSKRADLHCYFWPAAAWRLKEAGWFGFLVSSSWLDVEYGFALQGWILRHFRLHAILESQAEPWFADARIKTCAVILQRCSSAEQRREQIVKFVRLDAPLAELFGPRDSEGARQVAADHLRDLITRSTRDHTKPGMRIIVKRQGALWDEGVRIGRLLAQRAAAAPGPGSDDGAVDGDDAVPEASGSGAHELHEPRESYGDGYGGGKWGKYLRAPACYFKIMGQYGHNFVTMGEIATIRFGIKSGCDGFFMPKEVSQAILAKYPKAQWLNAPLQTHCKRSLVESGAVRLVQAGDGTIHPIEARFLAPEVHSLMKVTRPVIKAAELDRLVLQVAASYTELRHTLVAKYLRYGERTTFASTKSKAVPVSQRTSCRGRKPWYNLTGTKPGAFFWPMAQQYRHIIPGNPELLICNHNLFDVHPIAELCQEPYPQLLCAVANSTLMALFKTFYGRYAGTEGNLKTEVMDVTLMEIPDPRRATPALAQRLCAAFTTLCQRDTGELLAADLKACRDYAQARQLAATAPSLPWELQQPDRRALDLAVLELIGVADEAARQQLCDALYQETADHFRQVRLTELQKQVQRGQTDAREFSTEEMAGDLWDALPPTDQLPLPEWLRQQSTGLPERAFSLPEGRASLPDASDLFNASTVYFRQGAVSQPLHLPSRPHAELVHLLASEGISGELRLPASEADTELLLWRLLQRLQTLTDTLAELAATRTADPERQRDLCAQLRGWLWRGRPVAAGARRQAPGTKDADEDP